MSISLSELAKQKHPLPAQVLESVRHSIENNEEIDVGALQQIRRRIGLKLIENKQLYAAVLKCIRRRGGQVSDDMIASVDEMSREFGKGPADILQLHRRLGLPATRQQQGDPLGYFGWLDLQQKIV